MVESNVASRYGRKTNGQDRPLPLAIKSDETRTESVSRKSRIGWCWAFSTLSTHSPAVRKIPTRQTQQKSPGIPCAVLSILMLNAVSQATTNHDSATSTAHRSSHKHGKHRNRAAVQAANWKGHAFGGCTRSNHVSVRLFRVAKQIRVLAMVAYWQP